jgi:glycine/D-amino acid oxidase-like deaminating enzyme
MQYVLDRADVAVVGAGTVGITAAYFLKEQGLDVVVLERETVAWGASGRNAGFQAIQVRNPGIALNLARAGIEICDQVGDELGRTFEMRTCGGSFFFETDDQRRVMEEFAARRREEGVHVEVLDEAAARELSPLLPRAAIGCTYCPEDRQIRSKWFVQQLAQACVRRGVRIHEHTPVGGLIRTDEGGVAGVRTADGAVLADNVVYATGGWTRELEHEGVNVPIRPERLGVLMTEPIPERLNVVVQGPLGSKQYELFRRLDSFREEYFLSDFEDPESGYEYFEVAIQREDGCLQVGNPEDYADTFDQVTPLMSLKMMVEALLRRWPDLRGVGVRGFWSGLLPVTPDALPIVDAVDTIPGLYIGAGHIFGNTAGPSTGRLLSELVTGATPFLPIDDLALDRPALRQETAGMTRW